MAEGLLNHYGKAKIKAYSAGSKPTGNVHPKSLSTLKKNGINSSDFRSKSWDEFKDHEIDVVITVCDNAAGEICPVFYGSPIKTHWGVPDPAHFIGSEAEIDAEFERVFRMLEERVKLFFALPIANLSKEQLKIKLDEIGKI